MTPSDAFDPDLFMQETVDGSNDTVYPTIPAGEYLGVIDDVKIRRTEKDGKYFYPTDVTWTLVNPPQKVLDDLGRDKATVRQSVFLDLTDSGSIDLGKGKNIQLGRLREALDLNGSGFTLGKLKGAGPAKLQVSLKPDKDNVPRNNVTAVGKAN